jgi:hypothetical protein
MTPRQRRIIGALVIANAAIILALVVFVASFSPATSAKLLPSPVPAYPAGMASSRTCEQRGVELLSQADLAGTVSFISDGTLQLDIVYPIPQDQETEKAAQQVWTAFDIAQALKQDQCDTFSDVAVLIRAQGTRSSVQIRASVGSTDLDAFYNGGLSESDFIDRVQYEARPVDMR